MLHRSRTRGIWMLLCLSFLGTDILGVNARAGETPAVQKPEHENPAPSAHEMRIVETGSVPRSPLRPHEIELWLSGLVLIFGVIVLAVEFLLLRGVHTSASDVLRTIVVTV